MPLIREEMPPDAEAIREVNRLAFGGGEEAVLVDRLRDEQLVVVSLVAIEQDQIAGHILFSKLPIEGTRPLAAVSLAPMAVKPAWQNRGIGSALVRSGLDACRQRGVQAVVVVGHPTYYPRFGFSAELAQNLRGPFSGDVWMALDLVAGALTGFTGTVKYPAAFGIPD